jgi:RNA polymerase sigma-70 factor (ECF subfamily)
MDRLSAADPDLALVERLRGGDESAFEALMERYEGKVYRLAAGMMKNREDALDAVQDAFLSVFRKIDTFKGESAFSTWLYRIALNAVYMRLRSRSRHDRTESLETHEEIFDPITGHIRAAIPDWSERADDAVLRKELGGVIREAVASMPDDYRAIFTLRDVEDLSNQQVAEILGLTVAATKTRLHRARLFLRERLSRYLQGNSR